MSGKKEFEAILSALGERPLTEKELARLWELIEAKPERLEEYLSVQQMNFALDELNLSLVSEDNIGKVNQAPARKNYLGFLALAAALVAAGILFWIKGSSPQVITAEVNSLKPVGENVRSTDPLQEEYRKKIEELPIAGSLNRPPTEFSSVAGDVGKIDFNKDIHPILADNCISCHGPDAKSREADLRLDTYEGLLSENTVVPGNPEKSELVKRIFTDDEDDIMPPPDSHKKLSKEQKELLSQWIKEGAPWQKHWAYTKPVLAKLPESISQNPIDYFISKKLKSTGLKLSNTAARYELARRVAFDLTGLPPQPELLSNFILDRNPGAYSRYIDKLFKSPHYGEHMARYWLDAARYGDTHGMHLDNYREIWPYRDWVINAFNNNMPFDRFTIEQLAGDLLPDAGDQQLVATGFNRCNVTTSEGGTIPEEVAVRYMIDRVETTATVFMGLTAGCAACHDHKFDPITQREFYQLGAFFNNTTQPAMDGNQKDSPPVLTLPESKYRAEWDTLLSRRKQAHKGLELGRNYKDSVSKWWAVAKDSPLTNSINPAGLVFELLGDKGSHINGKPVSIKIPDVNKADPLHPSGKEAGIRFAEKGELRIDHKVELNTDSPFTLSMWIRSPDIVKDMTVLEIGEKKNSLKIRRNYQGGLNIDFVSPGGKVTARLTGDMALKPRSWQHLTIRYSGGQSSYSLRVTLDGEEKILRHSYGQYAKSAKFTGGIKLGSDFSTGGLSHIRLYNRHLSQNEVALQSAEFDFKRSFTSDKSYDWKELKDEQRELLQLYHKVKINKNTMQAEAVLTETQKRRDFIYSRSITTLVLEERSQSIPTAYVLERGEYDKKKEKVSPGIPKVFPPISPDFSRNRLGLAKWIVSPDNPLTARVTVNRLWQNVFGTGLVKTSEDFGIMGSQPTHPELLDWLAVEFVNTGWDVRHILRLIVSSKAYQQSGVTSSVSLEKDPDNLFISRGPRLRLDAEELRDQALAVSGLLKREVGGASVKPYQPAGLWKVVAFSGSNTKNFKADKGEKLYRRSLYTFWKRTSPPPSMAAFDAPTRENCTVRRERTNTPLQALVLMNDTQFVEAARFLAQRSLNEKSIELERLQWLFQTVIGRQATSADIADLSEAVTSFRRHFTKTPKIAENLVKTGESTVDSKLDVKELASWTMIVNILMNRDDFINN